MGNFFPAGEVQCDCTETNMQMAGGDYTLTNKLQRGSMLVYHCHDEGDYPYPHLVRVCQPNGRWNPSPKRFSPQRCKRVECPDPNVMEYGNVIPSQERYFVGNETTYECYSGYTLRGSSTRQCLPNGKWSGSTPICSRDSGDTCADPGIPAGASRTGNIFGIDDKKCFFPHKYSACGPTGVVAKGPELCMRLSVVSDTLLEISSFSVTPNYEIVFFSSEVYEVVNILDFLDGKASLISVIEILKNFTVGEKNTGTDLNIVFKTFLERMAVIKRRAGDEGFKEHRHVLIFFTDGAYNMGGSPLPTVERIKNMVYMNNTSDQQKESREEYLGDLCALFHTVMKKMFPWAAFNHKCLGSLVTPRFILTAAHCFKFGDTPEDVIVELNDGAVKTFTLHPKYNISAKVDQGVKEFYDNDVALIQLEEDVKISTEVRPICIPCTQETSNALKLVGDSTCKQQEQLLLKDQIERLNFLTRKRDTVGLKDVHAKLGDNVSFTLLSCVVSVECDSGGAVFKNYELRTIQVALVSWGSKEMCTGGGVVESDRFSRDFHINLFKVIPFLKSILGNDLDEYAPLTFLKN
uniref:C3/C5 convertase n=1 Tax=Acanthochromis polyacanthus TaxID=80966 RepID=A0A3Q1HJ57_9TELE